MSVIKCEMSVITMTLHWHNSQIFNLDNCVDDTPIETGVHVISTLEKELVDQSSNSSYSYLFRWGI